MSDPMSNKSGREALRGAEVLTFDLIFGVPIPEQVGLLRAALERVAAKGNRDLAQQWLIGKSIADGLHERPISQAPA